jgi:hypothetical protein
MVGATVTTLAIGGGMLTAPTVVLGLLASIVALGRRTSASPGGISLPSVLQAAHSSPSLASIHQATEHDARWPGVLRAG